jgi:hypothetical protein
MATAHRWVTGSGWRRRRNRLVAGGDAGQGDHGDDDEPGEVLGATIAVREAVVRWASGQPERHQQWTAVAASATLCRVSPSSATEP